MIEKSLIESARLIKNRYNNLTKTLSIYEGDVEKLAAYFIKVSDELKDIKVEISKKDTVETIKEKAMSKLNKLEEESNKWTKKISEINQEIEKLRDEEMSLYKIIKKITDLYPEIRVITVHDSIICSKKYKDIVEIIFNKIIKEEFDF